MIVDAKLPRTGPDRHYWRRRANREVRKARRSRALLRFAGILAAHLAVVVTAGITGARAFRQLTHTPELALSRIEVLGTRRSDPRAVRAALTPMLGRNLLQVDLAEAQSRVLANPWIARASFKRTLPHTLRVEVSERVPAAAALLGGIAHAVDAHGAVIGPCGPGLADDLPVLTGLDRLAAGMRLAALARGVGLLERIRAGHPRWAEQVSEMDLSRPDRVTVVTCSPGPELLLDPVTVERNLDPYLALRTELEGRAGAARTVDLRWSGRIVFLPEDDGFSPQTQ